MVKVSRHVYGTLIWLTRDFSPLPNFSKDECRSYAHPASAAAAAAIYIDHCNEISISISFFSQYVIDNRKLAYSVNRDSSLGLCITPLQIKFTMALFHFACRHESIISKSK